MRVLPLQPSGSVATSWAGRSQHQARHASTCDRTGRWRNPLWSESAWKSWWRRKDGDAEKMV